MRGVTSPVSPLGWSRGLRKSYKKRQKQKLGWFGLKYQVLFPLTEQQRKWSTEMQLNTKDFIFTKFAFTLFTKENPGLPKLRTPLKHLTGNTQLKSTNTIDNTWGERQHVIQGQKRGNMKTLKKIAQKTTHKNKPYLKTNDYSLPSRETHACRREKLSELQKLLQRNKGEREAGPPSSTWTMRERRVLTQGSMLICGAVHCPPTGGLPAVVLRCRTTASHDNSRLQSFNIVQ